MITLHEAEKISEAYRELEKILKQIEYVETQWSATMLGRKIANITLNGAEPELSFPLFGEEVETVKNLILWRLKREAYNTAREAGIALDNEEWFIIYHEEVTK